ncbi:MAG: response regulator [Gammaproteobacteria bacterium]|nr:response regulator [Gammaproteobacteria bacterium]MCZ6774135.1 response regulator [Pseudomonadota bacterium]MCZ6893312.1 response regulator [Gammaproteobacteria bacterium]
MQTSKPTIVLVDDSIAMRAFFEQVAEEADLDFHAYESAEESLRFLNTRQPNLLFLNIIMPNKDGFTFLKELRAHELHFDTPTVMISSKDYAQDRTEAKELGVLEFVAKPISKKAIRSLIDKYVGTGNADE